MMKEHDPASLTDRRLLKELDLYQRELERQKETIRTLSATLEQRVVERTSSAERRSLQLQTLATELVQAEQQERRLLAKRLHDNLQQLLYAIRLTLGTARRRTTDPALQRILQQADELVNQSLDESRSLTADISPPVLYDAGLKAAMEWLARQFREQHGFSVTIEADEKAEPIDEGIRGFLFASAKELLLNVLKHAKTREARVEITAPHSEYVHVVVTDHGTGFDIQQAANVTAGRSTLGLFSIQERLTALGGCFHIESAPGSGTRVTMAAPRNAPPPVPRRLDQTPSPELAPETPEHVTADGPGKIRVLVADDHQIVREGLVRMLLEEPDVKVVGEAANGQEAVEMAHRLHPHVVLMDVTMPVLGGVEATQQLAVEMPRIRVIGLSMHQESDLAASMRQAGAVAYLTKGGPFDVLMDTIHDCVPVQ